MGAQTPAAPRRDVICGNRTCFARFSAAGTFFVDRARCNLFGDFLGSSLTPLALFDVVELAFALLVAWSLSFAFASNIVARRPLKTHFPYEC
jgi:hypothetical protein